MPDIKEIIHTTKKTLLDKLPDDKIKKYLIIIPSTQKLYLINNENICFESFISTSKNGLGNNDGSYKTPVGLHRVKEKIGENVSKYTIFKSRQPTNIKYNLDDIPNEDLITSRIIWLDGIEKGINSGGNVDTYSRYIYIHGTPHENQIGIPVSHGCIRMKNDEIINLFPMVDLGTPVSIVDY
ncbi:MAG: L,D-transpeptidase [Pseudomonadota bacterium]|nr:L,D-transpeptidase [Pseudomonadota bacterium]